MTNAHSIPVFQINTCLGWGQGLEIDLWVVSIACMRPWILSPAPKKEKRMKNKLDLLHKMHVMLGTSGSQLNPSYSGGRDQEDQGSKPAPGKVSETLSRKKG
jgi:hypothetical protein